MNGLSEMFKKTNYIPIKSKVAEQQPEVPEGLLRKCNKCGGAIFAEEAKKNYNICPKCGGYFRVHARRRIQMIADENTFEEWDVGLKTDNPLQYKGYEEKIASLQEKTGLDEAIITGKCKIGGYDTVVGVMDGRFLMASMGAVVGEKITRAVERATEEKLPVILFTCSGGARMQEGITSLMQMEKTSAALKRHSDKGGLYVSVLTDPTTGGVTASFAMLGDIILAEPKALIGFAGPRVIEQTIGQKLPKGFQRSEFLLEHGFVDAIVERKDLKNTLTRILAFHGRKEHLLLALKREALETVKGADKEPQVSYESIRGNLSAWERVELSRKKERPVGEDYIRALFTDFVEMHGDRYYADDKAIMGGIAYFHGMPVTVIAQAKGKTTKENLEHNFGMPSPDGYRKALRLMKQAEKFHRPVICFVDTPGAFPGLEAEERGQGEAIARNLFELSNLKTPILSIVIGEGGSGGALAMAVADEVWMMENAVYSILSPEGYASILWKDSSRAKEAAELMRMTAGDLKEAGIVEQTIAEPEDYTLETLPQVSAILSEKIGKFLENYCLLETDVLLEKRYQRFRNM